MNGAALGCAVSSGCAHPCTTPTPTRNDGEVALPPKANPGCAGVRILASVILGACESCATGPPDASAYRAQGAQRSAGHAGRTRMSVRRGDGPAPGSLGARHRATRATACPRLGSARGRSPHDRPADARSPARRATRAHPSRSGTGLSPPRGRHGIRRQRRHRRTP